MVNKSKNIGTKAETATVGAIKSRGFPLAERKTLTGRHDCGDLTGTPRLCWQVKGGEQARKASDNQIRTWLEETEVQRVNKGAELGILVVQRAGVGYANAHNWHAYVTTHTAAKLFGIPLPPPYPHSIPVRFILADLCELLVAAGYGTPPVEYAA